MTKLMFICDYIVICALIGGAQSSNAASNKPLSQMSLAELMKVEIIVSTRKREENLQDIPLSIQAFSAEQLERV